MNKMRLLIVLVVILALAVITLGVVFFIRQQSETSNYYAVYLDTNTIYLGKMHRFPRLYLSDVYVLNIGEQGQVGASEFSKLPWMPKNEMQINKEHVVWMSKLDSQSPFFELKKRAQAQQPNTTQPIPTKPQTATPEATTKTATDTKSSSANP